ACCSLMMASSDTPSSSSTEPAPASGSSGSDGPAAGFRVPAPHELDFPAVDYRVVIPTRGRWRPACEIGRDCKNDRRPFILVKTLAFLKRHSIPPSRVFLYVSDEEEKIKYEAVLQQDTYWDTGEVRVEVGRPGIREQRNYIQSSTPEGTYVVSFDDDVSDVLWKNQPGLQKLVPMPDGMLDKLFFHGYAFMRKYKAFIWGLNTTASANPLCLLPDGVSSRNGEINGFCCGFITRHLDELMPQIADATEDAERSLRFFKHDRIILRYRMYCGQTKCFQFLAGLQDLFEGATLKDKNEARKLAERAAAEKLLAMFPEQTRKAQQRKGISTLEIGFRSIGGPVLPVTTVEALIESCKIDLAGKQKKGEPGSPSTAAGQRPKQKGRPRKSPSAADSERFAQPSAFIGTVFFAKPKQDPILEVEDDEAGECQGEGKDEEEEEEDEIREASDAHQEGDAENKELEAAVAASLAEQSRQQSHPGEQDDMVHRALQASMNDLALLFNGTVLDPMAAAVEQSRLLEEEDAKLKQQEEEEMARALQLSTQEEEQRLRQQELEDCGKRELELLDTQISSKRRSFPGQHSVIAVASPQNHMSESSASSASSASFSPQSTINEDSLRHLVDMGFERHVAIAALNATIGDLVQAVNQLLSSG
ncbi:unnamed protein product, partial [Polarella glacialis]